MIKKFFASPLVFTLLFAIYPILHLYSINVDEVGLEEPALFVAFLIVVLILLFFVFKVFYESDLKSALATSGFFLLFFSYGHVLDLVMDWKIGIFSSESGKWIIDWTFGQEKYIALFVVIALILWLLVLRRVRSIPVSLPNILNLVALILMVFPTFQIARYQVTSQGEKPWVKELSQDFGSEKNIQDLPDIYYIIPDGYASRGVLMQYYNYDNKDFLDSLTNKGFYVAEDAHSNYAMTSLSIPSALNLGYINFLTDILGEDNRSHSAAGDLLDSNPVKVRLKNLGYKWITFDSNFRSAMKKNTDLLLSNKEYGTEFLYTAVNTTPLRTFLNNQERVSPYEIHRNKILFGFTAMKDIAKIIGPTFTLGHIIAPHPPFVFDEQGNLPSQVDGFTFTEHHSDDESVNRARYVDQLKFVNKKLLETIDDIFKNSEKPPIIIIQSDHGPYSRYISYDKNDPDKRRRVRLGIVNAYYFPNQRYSDLYQDITPVNSFRVVLNEFFGGEYPLVEDKSYYSTYGAPYKFQEIPFE
jgi:hypothetical protein